MLKVGLTGGIGSGKSTVSQYFEELGLTVLDADILARELVMKGQPALAEIAKQLGTDLIDSRGDLDRERLRQRIFEDGKLRHKLEAILHPLIKQEIIQRSNTIDSPCIIIVVPLLIESEWTDLVDRVLVVDTSTELQLERSKVRDNSSTEQISAIIKNQASREQRLSAADDVIENNSDRAHLRQQVENYFKKYMTQGRQPEQSGPKK